MTTPPDLTKLTMLIRACQYDADALSNNNKSAATALRKKLSNISKEVTKLRASALAFQKSIPTKSRAKKPEILEVEEVTPAELEDDFEEDIPEPLELEREMTKVPVRTRKPRKSRGKRTGL